jgi:prepilin-type N-terminal cleavage/methylation domain-containing protein
MKSLKKSKAFSLIELVVSIIILGIIAVTIPVILQTFTTTAKVTGKENVFFTEFSLLSLINTKYFDENNTVGDNFYKDLNATGGDAHLYILSFGSELNRLGKHQMNNNIFRSGSDYKLSVIGPDKNETSVDTYDDIDDFNGYEETINVGVTSKGYKVKVKVGYIRDLSDYSSNNISFNMNYTILSKNAFTNIKLIEVYSKFSDGSVIKLEYPTCNIGASKILSLQDIR